MELSSMSNERLQAIWGDGYNAYFDGVLCPYDHDEEAQAWQDGYNQAIKDESDYIPRT
jgi:ribosome modulation factor